jgi:hypothetical protein
MCPHNPTCPDANAPDREAARTIASHPEQGWSLLCNGVVAFEDTGELLPGGETVAPHRPTDVWVSNVTPGTVIPSQPAGVSPSAHHAPAA